VVDALKRAAWLAAAYPGRSIDEAHIESWAEELSGLTEFEVDDVIAMLRFRAIDPPSVAQVKDAIREMKQETMSPTPMSGHVFIDETECPTCLVVHGGELESGQVMHGMIHLGEGDFNRATHPAECDCGVHLAPNINVEAVIQLVARGLVGDMKVAFDAHHG
jgi:hypothetical protein